MKKLLAVDGNSLVNRAFYGVKPLTTRDGKNTNAVYGFVNMLNHNLESLQPDYAAVAFDMRTPTFRHKACDFYKATRKGMPPELAEQFDDAKIAAEYLGYKKITCEGFEADDILGTLSSLATPDLHVYLLTGDRDSYQLVNDNVSVLYVSNRETSEITPEKLDEMFGLAPRKLIEVKALMGDTSDNIPGVKGIGEKTALDLVKKFGSVENLYENLENAEFTKSVKQKLTDGKDMAFTSKFLAEIKLDAPLGVSLDELEYSGINKAQLCDLCEKLELNSVISRLNLRVSDSETQKLEATILTVKNADITSLSDNICVDLDIPNGKIYALSNDEPLCLDLTKETLLAIFGDEKKDVTLCDVKSVMLYLYGVGIDELKCKFFDVMLASYVADPSSVINSDNLATAFSTGGVDISDEVQRHLINVQNLKKLRVELEKTIADHDQTSLLFDVEFPLALVLADMENTGFLVNREALEDYRTKLDYAERSRIETIYSLAGVEFNINSPKQLGEVLFERLHLPPSKKTKSGYSTDAESLEKLREYSPVIDEILEYRTISKLKSTYAEGLTKAIAEDGRLHTSFKQALTLTGRLSSADPNLQNIPVRTKEGREFRKVFIPEKGKVLIDADYSQIELRLMAAMSGDENMINTYKNGEDIHTMTASQVFGVPFDEVTSELRKRAKAVNFGIIYGISDFSLAGDIKVTKKEAGEYIKRYFEKYPKISQYLENVKTKAYEDGYVTTLFNRRRYIPELKSRIFMQKKFGERVAMNAPIQGTAADIIKIAMIRVYNRLKSEKLCAKLILQVHDELIIECLTSDAEKAKSILIEEMMGAVNLSVPLEVSAAIGDSWDDCH